MNRATADNQSAQAEDEGLEPTKEWVKDLVDEVIAEEFASPDLELLWLDEDSGAAEIEAQIEARVKIGAATLNELRDALGLDPFTNPAADRPMVLTPTGYVPIKAGAGGNASPPLGGGVRAANGQAAPAVQKYSPDQPRVPKGSSHGGEWTSEDSSGSSPDSMARPVADEHPNHERSPQYAALESNVESDADEGVPHGRPDADATSQGESGRGPQLTVPGSATGTDVAEDAPHLQPQRPKDGDADAAASGSKSEDGASLHDLVMQYYREQIQERGYDDLTAPGLHAYSTGWDLICSTGDSCTLENARSSVLAYQVPGYDGMTEGGGEYPVTLPGIGYIGDVHVYDNGLSISNLTLPGHVLYFGYITNTLEVRPDGIYVQTFGEGVNTSQSLADINAILGSRLFTQQHALMRQYFDANFGPN